MISICVLLAHLRGFPGGSRVKNPPANAGATGNASSIPESGRVPGGGNGNPPTPYSGQDNPMDKDLGGL